MPGDSLPVVTVRFSPSGRRIASAGLDAIVKIWDAEHGLELLTLEAGNHKVIDLEFCPDGQRLVGCDAGGNIIFWNAPRTTE
jgi:WD40 repeat protein